MGIPERWRRFAPLPPGIEQSLDELLPFWERSGVRVAYLFGSMAVRGEGRDVDLAFLGGDTPVFRLRETITEHLGTERVDLVNLGSASPVLRFEILRTGRLLYASDEASLERFEMETLRIYRDTAPMRARQREYLRERMAGWS